VAVWATAAETTVLAAANAKSNREIDMFRLLRFSSQAQARTEPRRSVTYIIKFERNRGKTGGSSCLVMAGLVPAIPIIWHCAILIEIAGTSPAMTP
jgi:hypothetical protein